MKKLKQLLLILVLSLSLTSPAVIPAMGTTTVSAATVRKPSLSNSKLTIYTGKSVLLKVNGTSGKVKWISQNKRIVTVDSDHSADCQCFCGRYCPIIGSGNGCSYYKAD